VTCYNCGKEIVLEDKVYRQSTCSKCESYLHCCLNCRFYDERAFHQCKEPEVRYVKEKDSANFCTYFEPSDAKRGAANSRADDARKKLDDLFKNSPDSEDE
jgi:hypothetical protein